MKEVKVKESDPLAEKLTVKDTFEISAKSVAEFDALMIEIQKKQEQFPQFSMDISCKWEHGHNQKDVRTLAVKSVPNDAKWDVFVNHLRKIENQVITNLNEGREEDDSKIMPTFSLNAKLKIELKDKEAQKALEDAEQLYLFTPYKAVKDMDESERKKFVEENKGFQKVMLDGQGINSVTFTKIN